MKSKFLSTNFRFWFVLIFLFLSTALSAQLSHPISGIITDKHGETLIGVNVTIQGLNIGTVTDINGKYSFSSVPQTHTLEFSYIGYKTKYQLADKNIIDIVLEEDSQNLEEIVVVGYGTQRKIDLTSSIASVDPKLMQKMPGGVWDALQGNIAGVNVSSGKIRVRGVGSINNTDPLWVVDGFIGGSIPNENEIESMQVLKDAASCAIYGARGANGVIIITTKRGEKGRAIIEYNGYGGDKWVSKKLDLMGSHDLSLLVNEAVWNHNQTKGITPIGLPSLYNNPNKFANNTQWQDAWFRNSLYQSHNINISGGSETASYRIGLNYGSNDGIVINNSGEYYGLLVNSELKKGWFTIGENLNTNAGKGRDGGGNYCEILRALPHSAIYDDSREDGFALSGQGGDGNDLVNQIAERNMVDRKNENLSVKSLTYFQLEPIKGLKYRFNLGIDIFANTDYEYKKAFDLGRIKNEKDDLSETSNKGTRLLMEHTLTYEKSIQKHNFSIMGGITSEQSRSRSFGGSASDFPDGVYILSSSQDEASKSVSGSAYEFAMYSQLARATYSYDNRYLLTANLRRDGSSKFIKEHRFGYFPSMSVGWRISEEKFIKGKALWLDNLKLRGSYGLLGNQDIDSYAYESSLEIANQYYVFNDKLVLAPIPMVFGNPGLQWETTMQGDFGLDLQMLDNRLSVTYDFYYRKTTDMLVKVAIPTTSGTKNGIYMNAGSIRNVGSELSISWRDKIKNFEYEISGNVSFVDNKVLKLGELGEPIYAGMTEGIGNVTRTAENSSIGRFYGYRTSGLFQSQEEVNNYTYTNPATGITEKIQPNAAPGDIKFIDKNGNGKLDDGDKDYIGSPIPIVSYGINIDLAYKGFDLSILGQGDYGNSIYNNGKSFLQHGTSPVNQLSVMNDRFRAEDIRFTNSAGVEIFIPKNTNTNIARAVYADPNGNFTRASDYFIEDGSYFRIKRITLGYTFNQSLLKKVMIDKLRVYVGMKNPMIFTNYTFFDPEVAGTAFETGGANLNRGIELQRPWSAANPTSTEIFFGAQLAF